MKVVKSGTVKRIYKDPVNKWCVVIRREGSMGTDTYINIPIKPKLKEGQRLKAGQEI